MFRYPHPTLNETHGDLSSPGAASIKQSHNVRSLRARKATWHIVAVDRK